MKIQLSNNAKWLCNHYFLILSQLSNKIIDIGLEYGWFVNNSEYYGYTIKDHLEDFDIDFKIAYIILEKHFHDMNQEIFDRIISLVTIGDGNCDECGGDMEFYEEIYVNSYFRGNRLIGTRIKCRICNNYKDIKL